MCRSLKVAAFVPIQQPPRHFKPLHLNLVYSFSASRILGEADHDWDVAEIAHVPGELSTKLQLFKLHPRNEKCSWINIFLKDTTFLSLSRISSYLKSKYTLSDDRTASCQQIFLMSDKNGLCPTVTFQKDNPTFRSGRKKAAVWTSLHIFSCLSWDCLKMCAVFPIFKRHLNYIYTVQHK